MNPFRMILKSAKRALHKRRVRHQLMKLDDRMLQDIGIPRSEVDAVLHFEHHRTRHSDL
jgi:uncharacterized protein YjiS (DUF1127 family)